MRVTLIDHTGMGHPRDPWRAAELMIFTKGTRVEMSPALLSDIEGWSEKEKLDELAYMANTIPSSWEFCDYTFMIEDVTRALTHQLVRNRHSSFAQQTQQILDVSGFGYRTGPTVKENDTRNSVYRAAMNTIQKDYSWLIEDGAKVEDARGLLPTNIHTNIVWKCNLRTLSEELRKREGPRNLGEIADLSNMIREAVKKAHPWVHLFLDRTAEVAARELDEMIKKFVRASENSLTLEDSSLIRTKMHKLVDQLRNR